MPDELEERLRSHASAFDSLLSLIPAKLYYGEDVSDQWQRKKQTPEQKRAARIAKLDPDNAKSAKDVMDERAAAARKRRRIEDGDDCPGAPTEPSHEGEPPESKGKRRKTEQKQTDQPESAFASASGSNQRKAEKRAAKRQAKQAKKLKEKEKAEAKRVRKEAELSNKPDDEVDKRVETALIAQENGPEMDDAIQIDAKAMTAQDDHHSTSSSSPDLGSTLQSPHHHSVSSSISSIQPPLDPSPPLKSALSEPSPQPSTAEVNALPPQQRLEARIKALRAERKADNPGSRQPRNRQELLEQRRHKEEERRAHKKELRLKAKEAEMRKQEEEIAKRFSPGGSGSLIASPRSPMDPDINNFSFSRVAFGDGTHADPSLSSLLAPRKKHGASDTSTALRAVKNKTSRLSGLDSNKRQEIEEKDMWLNAKKRAHGEKVRDDTSLLKKALKRQEKGKKKSEKEWQGRIEGVAKSQESRQKKRTDNIKKRREEKGGGSGGKKGANKSGKGKKPKVKRPGFEGSFKAKHSSGGKG